MSTARQACRWTLRWASVWGSLACASLLVTHEGAAQIQRVHRDQWQNVEGVFAAMGLSAGDTVADVGAGDGFFTVRIGERLGSSGKVYAVDIDRSALDRLRRAAERAHLDNVEIVRSAVDDPMLPPRSVKAVLMVITYHELTAHEAMLAGIKRALRPGGRLVILDNPARDPSLPRETQMARHHLDISIVERDLAQSGFEVIRREPDFIDVSDAAHRHRQWMLVAVAADEQRDRDTTGLAEGEAIVTYLDHAGWAVRTKSRLLVFDYWEREPPRGERSLASGYISPGEQRDERVVVFVSHAHGDHWDPVVLGWPGIIGDVTYMFGWEAPANRAIHRLTQPRAVFTDDGLEVRTVNHDFDGIPEVAFLVTVDGLVIYHSGDHGSVSDDPNPVFKDNVDYLAEATARVDLAFMSVFGRRGGGAVNGGDRYAIERLRPKVTFPMHQGGNEGFYAEFASEARRLGLPTRVQPVQRRGDTYLYAGGMVRKLR